MIGFDMSTPPHTHDGATVAVLLHGRGSHRGDLQALRTHIPDEWILVTPQAPHPGHPWGYGPGWAWYRYLAEDRLADETLETSLDAMDAFLDQLPAIVGVTPGRVALGGFSQGGTVSLAYALTRPGAVDVAFNFSGFLADSGLLPDDVLSADATPIFWGHGTRDPNIPHALAQRGRSRLRENGVPHDARDYDIGHWIDPEEIADAVSFLERATG